MPQTFLIKGQLTSGGRVAYSRLRWEFGEGYELGALVRHQDGREFVNYLFNALSDRPEHNITDPEDSTSKTRMHYALDFLKRREGDGAAFNVTTARGATLLVYLDEDEISWETITKRSKLKLFHSWRRA
jgi:hypothetical protein